MSALQTFWPIASLVPTLFNRSILTSDSGFPKPGENGLLIFSESFLEVFCPCNRLLQDRCEFAEVKFKFPPMVVPEEGIFKHPRRAPTTLLQYNRNAFR